MKKIITLLSMVVLIALALGTASAAPPSQSSSVTVNNTASNPVPVSGSVSIFTESPTILLQEALTAGLSGNRDTSHCASVRVSVANRDTVHALTVELIDEMSTSLPPSTPSPYTVLISDTVPSRSSVLAEPAPATWLIPNPPEVLGFGFNGSTDYRVSIYCR